MALYSGTVLRFSAAVRRLCRVFMGLCFLPACAGMLPAQTQTRPAAATAPTFLLFKYQHPVGDETDQCERKAARIHCTARFELRFTGDSVLLEAEIETSAAYDPLSYIAKGGNSTRSDLDLSVKINGGQAGIRENGQSRTAKVPAHAFTLAENAPLLTQELMLAFWKKQGRPRQIPLLPAGEVRITRQGADQVMVSGHSETLTRYTVHGVTWGDETVWLNAQEQIAALIGADAEEDRFEALRPQYVPAMKQLVKQAAADAVASLEAAGRAVRPLAGGMIAFTHATVIDPRNALPMHDATILIKDGRIAAVGAAVTIPPGARVFDAQGKFILPGLWDTHAHFEQWEWGPAFLASGITSVRDVGNEIEFLTAIRASMNAGRGLGPMMYAAGLIDSDPGSLTSEHAEDAATVRRIVRRYHDLGYEEMKIYQSLKPELIPVVAAEAHQLGMKVTGHVPTGSDALRAVADGMDQINHIGFAARMMRAPGTVEVRADSPEAQKAVRFFLDHHTIIEPTLARSEFNGHPHHKPFGEIEPSVAWLPPELAIILVNAGVPAGREARSAAAFQASLSATRILHDAGITILAGSDQVVPGHSLHRELELLVQAGLSPLEAIRCATTAPPAVLGIAGEVGAIQTGMRADLVVLDADPLQNISNIRRVHWTVSRGRVFEPAGLWKAVDIRPPVW